MFRKQKIFCMVFIIKANFILVIGFEKLLCSVRFEKIELFNTICSYLR